jgi:calcineurin-like phosphoesterase family protein
MNTWFTSDNHFSHKNIHKFCPATRPHSDPTEMDNHMINRWNTQVHPEDTVWMLGDVFFSKEERALQIIRRLNGHKHLVYGNHDQVIRNSTPIQAFFESIQEYKELVIDGTKLCLFHYPIYEWNKIHHGVVHLHGHIHERLSGVPGKILNVCVDSPTFGTGDYSLYHSNIVLAAAKKLPERPHGKGEKE